MLCYAVCECLRDKLRICPLPYLLGEVDIFGPAALHVPHGCVLRDQALRVCLVL